MVLVCLTQQMTYCVSYLDMYRVYECLYAAYQSVLRKHVTQSPLSLTHIVRRADD
jgi:hypothetical protein